MAEFDREFLKAQGVPEDAAEAVMEAYAEAVKAAAKEAVEGMLTAEEAQKRVEAAVEGLMTEEEAQRRVEEALAQAGADGEAYRKLAAERDMLRAIGGEAFEGVKPKFREQVYAMLDLGPRAKPVEEQMEAIREKYEEYFIDGGQAQRLPRFGGPTRGSMPRGAVGAAEQFSLAWGFGPRRNG